MLFSYNVGDLSCYFLYRYLYLALPPPSGVVTKFVPYRILSSGPPGVVAARDVRAAAWEGTTNTKVVVEDIIASTGSPHSELTGPITVRYVCNYTGHLQGPFDRWRVGQTTSDH